MNSLASIKNYNSSLKLQLRGFHCSAVTGTCKIVREESRRRGGERVWEESDGEGVDFYGVGSYYVFLYDR
jgi:hypothetical protein